MRPWASRRRRSLPVPAALVASIVICACATQPRLVLFLERDGLVTNEYAFRHPDDPEAAEHADLIVTSGSLFARGGAGWTGPVDNRSPGPRSARSTNSAVFRMLTRRRDFADASVRFGLRLIRWHSGRGVETHDWDGVHVLLRYSNPQTFYSIGITRRDGTVVAKKKRPGGPSNGGTYTTLAQRRAPFSLSNTADHEVVAGVQTLSGGRVRLSLRVDGAQILAVVDEAADGRDPILEPGRVGIRGDNVEFEFRDLTVR